LIQPGGLSAVLLRQASISRETVMSSQKNFVRIIAFITFIAVLVVAGAMLRTAVAQNAAPKSQDKLALGEDDVKQLLLLMDTDKNGKISKEEYMKFMEAEFERLDKDKNGELDTKELLQSSLRVTRNGQRLSR
jgi:EF hand domain-containing protein